MGALVTFLLTNPALVGMIVAIIGGLGFGAQQRLAGAKAERNKQAADRLADRAEADKKEQAKWSRPKS
jgi:hypothetical protein